LQDYELIKRIRQGERALFGELAERYYDVIYCYCYYQTGNEQAAWDCTQETFYHLMRFLDTYTEKGKFKAYLLRIALNACRDYFRQSKNDNIPYDAFAEISTTEDKYPVPKTDICSSALQHPSPENQVETGIMIQNALNQLPEFQRETIILFYYYGYKQREIAKITGVPLSTVKTRLRAATEKLRDTLFPSEERRIP